MSVIYNVDEEKESEEDGKVANVEHDIRRAKMFLQEHSPESGDSLYNHLSELLRKILSERPRNAIDVFDDYSKKVKEERCKSKTNYIRQVYVPSLSCEEAKKFLKLYQALTSQNEMEDVGEDEEMNDRSKRTPPDLLELFFHLEQIEVGLPRSELVALNFSIRKLIAEKPIQNVRFWGKIMGKPKNYNVIEAELLNEELLARRSAVDEAPERGEETPDRIESEEKANEKIMEEARMEENEVGKVDDSVDKLKLDFPPVPKNLWKEGILVPAEDIGVGANKYIYYICNSPGIDDWIELPSITPQEIVAARQIVRAFTGHLDTRIHTFPPFLGTEKNYLRAQIARISASTLVSPIGFFTFGESLDEGDEEEANTEIAGEEDEAGAGTISENRHYEPLPLKELIDPSLSNWCHHSPYILKQGRTIWWDPRKGESRRENELFDKNESDVVEDEEEEEKYGDEEEDDEEGGDGKSGEFEREVGPPLLTPLSEDSSLGTIGAWTARASSTIKSNNTAIAIVRSNIWPGSFAFATGKRFANIYVGVGQKLNPYNYSPPEMPIIQEQYIIGPEVMEMQDPNFEEEEAYRIAHLPPGKPGLLDLGGEQEEEEEYDEDDDDDED